LTILSPSRIFFILYNSEISFPRSYKLLYVSSILKLQLRMIWSKKKLSLLIELTPLQIEKQLSSSLNVIIWPTKKDQLLKVLKLWNNCQSIFVTIKNRITLDLKTGNNRNIHKYSEVHFKFHNPN